MPITLTKPTRDQAIASIERYFKANFDESFDKLGNLGAGALLGFFLEEIAPSIYNQAVADVQDRLQQRVMEVDLEVHEDEFGYWHKFDPKARKPKGG